MKVWKILSITMVVAVAVAAWLGFLADLGRHGLAIKKADAATATKVHAVLADTLAKDAELTQRLGDFVRLEGKGYQRRNYTWQLIERMEMSRTAVFARGSVKLAVTVYCGEAEDLDQRPVGSISWKVTSGADGSETLEVTVQIDQGAQPSTPYVWPWSAVALSADTGTVFVGRRYQFATWQRGEQVPQRDIEGRFGLVNSFAHAARAGLLAVECEEEVKLMETGTGKFVSSVPIRPAMSMDEFPRIALSGDGQSLIYLDYCVKYPVGGIGTEVERMATVRNLVNRTSTELTAAFRPDGRLSHATGLYLAPDGRHVVLTRDFPRRILCWDLGTRTLIWDKVPADSDSDNKAATFTPLTGKFCLFQGSSKHCSLQIWNTETGELERTLATPSDKLWSKLSEYVSYGNRHHLAVSPDESLLAMSDPKGHALIWDLPSGQILGTIFDRDWILAGSVANGAGREWKDSAPTAAGNQGSDWGRPYRGEKLAALGFNAANELIAVSLFPDVAWVWKSDVRKLLPKK